MPKSKYGYGGGKSMKGKGSSKGNPKMMRKAMPMKKGMKKGK